RGQLASTTASVEHQATHGQQLLDQAGAFVDVVLGDVPWEHVVVLVGNRGVERVLALLGIALEGCGQQLGDAVAGIENPPACGALQRLTFERAATVGARQRDARRWRGEDRHRAKDTAVYSLPCRTTRFHADSRMAGRRSRRGGKWCLCSRTMPRWA